MEATDKNEEQKITAVYQQLIEAWNQGDGQAYGALFTEDANYIDVTGTNTQGGRQIGAMHQHLFQTFLKGSQLSATITSIRFLHPDVALLHTLGETTLPGQTEPTPDRASIQTMVAVKEEGKWLFSSFQNTRILPMPPRR